MMTSETISIELIPDDPVNPYNINKIPLKDYVNWALAGIIQLPDFQRDYCWSDEANSKLLAAVSEGKPFGSILLLENGNPELKIKPRLLENVTLKNPVEPKKLILDGQQRSTCLFMALLSGKPVVINQKRSRAPSSRWYYIDIEMALTRDIRRSEAIVSLPENKIKRGFGNHGTINCSTPEHEFEQLLFPVSQVFNFINWRTAFYEYWKSDKQMVALINKFEAYVIKKFEYYQIPTIELCSSVSKTTICEVFEDINKRPSDMNSFDIITALFATSHFKLREDFERVYTEFKPHKVLHSVRNLDWLQAVTLVTNYYRRQEAIKKGVAPNKLPFVNCAAKELLSLSLSDYQRNTSIAKVGFERAARFLHGLKIQSPVDVAYPVQLVILAAILAITGYPNESQRAKLEQWWWSKTFGESFSGWHEKRIPKDMLEIPAWLDGADTPESILNNSFTSKRLLGIVKRLGAIYKGFNSLIRYHGAIDFASGEALSDVNFFNDPIESHHIFPESWCKKHGIPSEEYNSLINRTPLSEATNRFIGGQAPSVYLTKLIEHKGMSKQRLNQILRSHLIDPDSLCQDDFKTFFILRQRALIDLIGNAIGKPIT